MPTHRYRYDGQLPAEIYVRGEGGFLDEILQPGQEFESEVEIHNPVISRLDGKRWVPALRSPELIGEFDGSGSHLAVAEPAASEPASTPDTTTEEA